MQTQKIRLENSIIGFLFLIGLLFLLLTCLGIYNLGLLLCKIEDYLPYLTVILVVLSYFSGVALEVILQKISWWFFDGKYPALEDVRILSYATNLLQEHISNSFAKLVFFRTLTFEIPFVTISIAIWIIYSGNSNAYKIILLVAVVGIVLFILVLLTWIIHRKIHKQFMEEAKKMIRKPRTRFRRRNYR